MSAGRHLVALTLAAVCAAAAAAQPAGLFPGDNVGGLLPKAVAKPKNITFTATLLPADPFSDLNAPGAKSDNPTFARGEVFRLVVTGTPKKEWHTYPLTVKSVQQEGQLSKLTVNGNGVFVPLYPVVESEPQWKDDKALEAVYLEHDHAFTWTQDVYVKPDAKPDTKADLVVNIEVQVCNVGVCVVEKDSFALPVTVGTSEAAPVDDLQARTKPAELAVKPVPPGYTVYKKDGDPSTPDATDDPARPGRMPGLLGAIVTAVIGGFVSLLTPCVFPMIPITVSYFLKQSETSKSSAVLNALLYSGTIVIVLTAGGLVLLQVLVQISTHYVTNFAIGAIFLVFALSLLGAYDITLPSWLQDMTASREGQGGFAGTIFMALTFSIISFACVGPIYGGFITLQATNQTSAAYGLAVRVLPVVAYSVAFASPFFFLALFPSVLKSMPRAGSWMNSVKVVMGFLELAAVVKFLRGGELALTGTSEFLTYDLCLGIYVALSIACGLYLLGVFRLPHDHDHAETISVSRLVTSLGFIALGLYLLPGIAKADKGDTRPKGTVFYWVDSFLLPDPAESPGWFHSLPDALAEAKKQNKLVFLDFTGTLCTNCKLNERQIFPRPAVAKAMDAHDKLKLYTDVAPKGATQVPDEKGAMALRDDTFKSNALPLYALVRPKGDKEFDIVATYNEGLIQPNDVPRFLAFLGKK